MLVSGGFEPQLYHWDLHSETVTSRSTETQAGIVSPQIITPRAHDGGTMAVVYHPYGHLLASSGRDGNVKLWARARPGFDGVERSSGKGAGKG